MYFESFDSTEEMLEALRKRTAEANTLLHPVQRELTYGSFWMYPVDVGARLVAFGEVYPLDKTLRLETEAGATEAEIATTKAGIEERLADGYLYGRVYDRFSPSGEAGDTHRYNAWPIEERLFRMAQQAGWDIDDLDDVGKILMQIAYGQWRGWRREANRRFSA